MPANVFIDDPLLPKAGADELIEEFRVPKGEGEEPNAGAGGGDDIGLPNGVFEEGTLPKRDGANEG